MDDQSNMASGRIVSLKPAPVLTEVHHWLWLQWLQLQMLQQLASKHRQGQKPFKWEI